jgi:hypothetical protein
MSLKTAGDALNWLLQPDTAVTRECVEQGEFVVFNQDTKQFEWRDIDGIIEVWDEFEIGGADMMVNDWILGHVADDGQVAWRRESEPRTVTPSMLAKLRKDK